MTIEERAARAVELKASCNCAQAVVLSYADKLPLEEETLKKLAAGYGGGIWRQYMVTSPNPTSHTNHVYTFLAEGVERVAEQHTEAGEDIRVYLMTETEVRELLDGDEIMQCLHAAPLWRWMAEYGRREEHKGTIG